MTRLQVLLPALAIVALLLVAPSASAATTQPPHPASIEFDLPANNGLDAHVQTFDDVIILVISRKGRSASYATEGESTEAGLKARFGKLGLIDVTFQPTKTLKTNKPPKGCTGEPETDSEGLFVGTIQFAGEREYVRIETSRVKGEMEVTPEWNCPRRKEPFRGNAPPPPPALSLRAKREAAEATLYVHDRRCHCRLGALAFRDPGEPGLSGFYGMKMENREDMGIVRMTITGGGASAFVFDHKAGTASLDPPLPFTGTATFKRRPGRDLWRSTIRIPLLGAAPISIRGKASAARLVPRLPSGL